MQEDKHENLYVDAIHYNAAFSREIAAQICENIQSTAGDHHSMATSSPGAQ